MRSIQLTLSVLAVTAVTTVPAAAQMPAPMPRPAPSASPAPLPVPGAVPYAAVATRIVETQTLRYAYRLDENQLPPSWPGQEPSDSLWRQARELLNRGDYRRAAALLKDLAAKSPNASYAAEAPYWQAFALYRIGGTSELQEALAVLEAQKLKFVTGRKETDASALATRIAGVLSSRGFGEQPAVKRALAASSGGCDSEDQSVRAEALNALMETDREAAQQLAGKVLARRDECSVPLRRNAVFLVGNRRDPAATGTLIGVAKGDPSSEVRAEAVQWLARTPGDEALAALEQLVNSSDDERLRRTAVRALASHPSPRARASVRAIIERNGASDELRTAALDGFDRDRVTTDDITWLRTVYPKIDSPRVRSRLVSVIGRIGGEGAEQFLLGVVRNDDEPIEARMSALRRVGETMDLASLGKLYDSAPQRFLREETISVLANRKEPEAVDKLLDIARSGTDPQLRRAAINVLSRKKDPRTTKLLLEIITK